MTFEDAYRDVRNDWTNRESERRMRELLGRLAASTIVRTNETSPYLTGRKRTSR